MRPKNLQDIESAKNQFRALASMYEDGSISAGDNMKYVRFYSAMARMAQTLEYILSSVHEYPSEQSIRDLLRACSYSRSLSYQNTNFVKKILASPNFTDAEKVKIMKEIANGDF